jgi:hypothetical protein
VAGDDPMHATTPGGDVSRLFLLLLCAGDGGFIALHLVHTLTDHLASPLFSLERDRGHAEMYQYMKYFWGVLVCSTLAWRLRGWMYAAWCLVFAYMLLDDAFTLHERYGTVVGERLSLPSLGRLGADDLGQLIIFGGAGVVAVGVVAAAYLRSGEPERSFARTLGGLLAALVFLGVGVDAAHVTLLDTAVERFLVIVEDGGEMLVVSTMLWVAVSRWARAPARVPAFGA